jgi:hypothetical protein
MHQEYGTADATFRAGPANCKLLIFMGYQELNGGSCRILLPVFQQRAET